MVQLLWEIVWQVLRKLNIESPYDPAIPLLGTYPQEMGLKQIQVHTCSEQHYSQQLKGGNNPNVH